MNRRSAHGRAIWISALFSLAMLLASSSIVYSEVSQTSDTIGVGENKPEKICSAINTPCSYSGCVADPHTFNGKEYKYIMWDTFAPYGNCIANANTNCFFITPLTCAHGYAYTKKDESSQNCEGEQIEIYCIITGGGCRPGGIAVPTDPTITPVENSTMP